MPASSRLTSATGSEGGLSRHWNVLSVLFLAGFVPAVLILAHVILEAHRWAYVLGGAATGYRSMQLLTAFTASYVHASPAHLANNLLFYLIILAALYPLAAIARWRRKLLVSVGVFLLVLPFVTAWASRQTDHVGLAMGFSGVNAALLGLLPVILFAALGDRGVPHAAPKWSVVPTALAVVAVVWSTGAGVTTAIGHPPSMSDTVVITAGTVGLTVVGWKRVRVFRLLERLLAPDNAAITLGCGVFGIGLGSMFFLVEPGAGVNVFAHLVGFIAGFVIAYLAFVAGPTIVHRAVDRIRNRHRNCPG